MVLNMRVTKSGMNIMAIIFGLITANVLYYIFYGSIVLPAVLTGLVAGFFVNSNFAKSVLSGIVISFIGLSIGSVVINSIINSYYVYVPLIPYQPSIGELLIVSIVFGALGGYIGFYMWRNSFLNA